MQNDTWRPRASTAGDGMHPRKRSIWRSPVNKGLAVGLVLAALCAPRLWMIVGYYRGIEFQEACFDHQRALGYAILAYARDHGQRYPPARDWCDRVRPYLEDDSAFVCLAAKNRRCSYAFNAQLSGLPMASLVDPGQVILLFESDRGWNAAGGRELLVEHPRHGGEYYICARADGTVALTVMGQPWHLRWQPKLKPAGPGAGAGSSPP